MYFNIWSFDKWPFFPGNFRLHKTDCVTLCGVAVASELQVGRGSSRGEASCVHLKSQGTTAVLGHPWVLDARLPVG